MTLAAPIEPVADAFGHKSIRASAGSGKTFQLTNRYLQLITAGAEPGSILASTFTRLAAGQIRDRVLARLADAVDQSAKRKELSQHLGVQSLSRQALLDVLVRLARSLHHVQIRTLDSFFASIVHAFAIELDMPVGAAVVDDNAARAMRSEAIRLMLDERQPQEMVDLLRLLTQGSSERAVCSTIDSVVLDLYGLYREACDEAWECIPELPGRLPVKALIAAIQHLEDTACSGDNRHAKAHLEDCVRARNWEWEAFISSGLAKAIASGSCAYYKKPISDELIGAYEPLVKHAAAELVNRVRDQTIATRDLLRLFHAQYESIKHRQGAITFADLTAAMAKAHELGKMDEIGFRLDARLRHLLLDEFQDTSIPQWRALAFIAQEIVSYAPPERTFFCVGDVKQSIYGWRHAAPEVLDELPRLLTGIDGTNAIAQTTLARSYRSSQPVIDAVNLVFESLASNEALQEFAEAVAAWQTGFTTHDTAKDHLAGYVELRTTRAIAEGEGEEKDHVRLMRAAQIAADLHKQNPHVSIAILTRTNQAVARLLYELGPNGQDISASGRGGGPLTDAAPVNAILDLLQMADHPDDTVAAFNVAMSPIGAMVGLTEYACGQQRQAVALAVRHRLVHEGYGATIADWVRRIASCCDEREVRRLQQLVELAGSFDDQCTLRPNDFVDIVEQTCVADMQPAAVQVMTIHQAKGLEFDAVILPELEGLLSGSSTPPVVFEREGETGPITRVSRYMNKEVLALAPELQPLFDRYKRRTVRESLSVLYVAMTRAIHGLYMIIDPPNPTERSMPKKFCGVLRAALAPVDHQPDTVLFAHGEPKWIQRTRP